MIFQYTHWYILAIWHTKVAYVSSKIWVQKQENKDKNEIGKINNKNKIGHIFFWSFIAKKLKIKTGPQTIRFNNNNKSHDVTASWPII